MIRYLFNDNNIMNSDLIHIANITDIEPSGLFRAIINDHAYLLACIDGEYFCTDDLCTHEDSSLYLGSLHGDCVSCTLHGSRFNLKTGEPLDEPATEYLTTYPLTKDGDKLFIKLNSK